MCGQDMGNIGMGSQGIWHHLIIRIIVADLNPFWEEPEFSQVLSVEYGEEEQKSMKMRSVLNMAQCMFTFKNNHPGKYPQVFEGWCPLLCSFQWLRMS